MSIKWPNTKVTEFEGLNFASQIIHGSKCIFNKIDGSTDIGLDGYIEFTDSGAATGFCIAAQIKSGDTNLSSDHSKAYLKSDKDHFIYWDSHILPVAGIVYIPLENQAYWVNIKKYLEENPTVIECGPYQIPVDKANTFSIETFQIFHSHFKDHLIRFDDDLHFGRALKLLASDDKTYRFEAIKSLFYYHRNSKETWVYLLRQLSYEGDKLIQYHLIKVLVHLVPVGDIWLHAGNVINSDIEKYAKSIIKKNYGLKEIEILLKHVDENGFTRGGLARYFPALIGFIPDRIEILKKIILNNRTTNYMRFFAALAIIYDLQFYDLPRAVNFAQSMIDNFPQDEDGIERFQGIKSTLELGEFFDIY